MMARSLTAIIPQPTSMMSVVQLLRRRAPNMPLVVRRSRLLRPPGVPRLVRLCIWGAAKWTLDTYPCKGRGSARGCAPSWCMACLLGQWMVRSLLANASAAAGGSPPPMPKGGGRSYLGRKWDLRLPQLSLVVTYVCAHRIERYPRSFAADASTASPTRTE